MGSQGCSRGAGDALKDIKIKTGKEWVADEMRVNVGGQPYWLRNGMDHRSRFLLATRLTPRRVARAAAIVMEKAKAAANPPEIIRTDQLRSYGPAVWRAFGGTAKHLVSDGMRSEIHNNLSERLQGTIRERDKPLRSMKTQQTGRNFLDGWAIDYNLCRPHMEFNRKTPAKAAGYKAPFADWQDGAQTVEPIIKPNRPARHTRQERRERQFHIRRGT